MHPFRTLPDVIDGVICGCCGHPVWDHCNGDTCSRCDRSEPDTVCGAFILAGFTVAPAKFDERALQR